MQYGESGEGSGASPRAVGSAAMGPGNSFWRTEQDTLDKTSGESVEAVGAVVLESLAGLE